MLRTVIWAVVVALAAGAGSAAANDEQASDPSSEEAEASPIAPIPLDWLTSYGEAMRLAEQQERMLVMHFYDPANDRETRRFEEQIADPAVREKLDQHVLLRLPVDARIKVDGEDVRLLDHAAFADMQNHEGIAVIDYQSRDSEQYGLVVTTLPFQSGRYYRYQPEHVRVLLELPAGTLTQRTMVFAVRIHPEAPASTKGDIDPTLLQECRQHCQHQASIRVQGHHNWDNRFHRIRRLLPFGLRPQEVVAESWPQQNLLDAAVDCVASWRHSSGHWSAVKRQQPRFGYDIKRGTNGIWYATGIFGNYH